jgi:undecaprenyl-diphosphatase
MTLLQAVVLGLIQGITEFLPVSVTAHLRIVPALFGWQFYGGTTNDPGAAFTAIVSLGTMLAIVVYFWRELLHVAVAWAKGFRDAEIRRSLECRLGWYLILATIPLAVLGLVFHDRIERGARNLWVVSVALVAFAILLGAAERIGSRRREEEQIDSSDAIAVGAAQVLALIPGASRAGATITAGLFRGLTRETAARFAFLLSIPAVVLSGIYEAARIGSDRQHGPGAGLTGLALVIAFVVGLGSLAWFMRWVTRHSTFVFVYYRIALGVLVMVLLGTGTLEATG